MTSGAALISIQIIKMHSNTKWCIDHRQQKLLAQVGNVIHHGLVCSRQGPATQQWACHALCRHRTVTSGADSWCWLVARPEATGERGWETQQVSRQGAIPVSHVLSPRCRPGGIEADRARCQLHLRHPEDSKRVTYDLCCHLLIVAAGE